MDSDDLRDERNLNNVSKIIKALIIRLSAKEYSKCPNIPRLQK